MSKEGWVADYSMAPALGDAPGFVAHAPFARTLSEGDLARILQKRKGGFDSRDPGTWQRGSQNATPNAFVAGFGPLPVPPQAKPPVAEPEEVLEECVAEVEAAPEPPPASEQAVEILPPVDEAEVFAAGFAEGERVAREAYASDVAACARLMARLSGSAAFDRAMLRDRLRDTVLALVSQVIGECDVSPQLLGKRVERAIGYLADVTEPARLYLHPEDLAMIAGGLAANVAPVADAAIDRGGFRLETLSATIEDGPALWLDQLSAALDGIALPD